MNLYKIKTIDDYGIEKVKVLALTSESQVYTIIKEENQTLINFKTINHLLSTNYKRKQFYTLIKRINLLLNSNFTLSQISSKLKSTIDTSSGIYSYIFASTIINGKSFKEFLSEINAILFIDSFVMMMLESLDNNNDLKLTFSSIENYINDKNKIISGIISTAVYPLFLFISLIALFNFFIIFVLPRFSEIYDNFNTSFSGMSGVIFGLSNFINTHIYSYLTLLFAIPIITYFSYIQLSKSSSFQIKIQMIKSKFPILKKINKQKFLQLLIHFTKSGITIEDSLTHISNIEKNNLIKQNITNSIEKLKKGGNKKKIFNELNIFNTYELQMIDDTNSIEKLCSLFEKINSSTDEEINTSIKLYVKFLEPLLMIITGLMISGLMAVMLLPMMNMMKQF